MRDLDFLISSSSLTTLVSLCQELHRRKKACIRKEIAELSTNEDRGLVTIRAVKEYVERLLNRLGREEMMYLNSNLSNKR